MGKTGYAAEMLRRWCGRPSLIKVARGPDDRRALGTEALERKVRELRR
jgi:hypothetical protein